MKQEHDQYFREAEITRDQTKIWKWKQKAAQMKKEITAEKQKSYHHYLY